MGRQELPSLSTMLVKMEKNVAWSFFLVREILRVVERRSCFLTIHKSALRGAAGTLPTT